MGLDEAPERLPEGAAGSLAPPPTEVEIKNPDVPLPKPEEDGDYGVPQILFDSTKYFREELMEKGRWDTVVMDNVDAVMEDDESPALFTMRDGMIKFKVKEG